MSHPRLRELLLLVGVAGIYAIGWVQLGSFATAGFFSLVGVFAALHAAVRTLARDADPLVLPIAALLVAIGLLQLASIDRANADSGTGWSPLAPLQSAWLAVAAVALVGTLYLFRNGLGAAWRVRYTLAFLGIAALLSPLIPGIGHTVNGARLWLRIGPLSFQPGEAAKVLVVLFLAAYLSERRELISLPTRSLGPVSLPDPRYIAPLLGLVGLSLFIFVQQNDLGSTLIFFLTFMAVLWIATGKPVYPLTGIALFAVGVYVILQTFGRIQTRFEAWLNPALDPQGAGFQILQGQYALAEGGLTGVGLAGPDAQPNLVPVGWSDYALATVGYTLGLAGTLVVVMAFVVLLTRTFHIALRSRSDLHALAAAGFGVVIGIQAGIIAGGVTRVLPLTGVTLPFVSYGGSSLLANFVIVACLLAISGTESTTETAADHREEYEEAGVT